jgi:hypothetical protein
MWEAQRVLKQKKARQGNLHTLFILSQYKHLAEKEPNDLLITFSITISPLEKFFKKKNP